ncbi:hypothetical protein GXW82_43085 [Streptacidiphilus sp. 4-A2]|nr:hypothetical protein [Streptacidiphilus sp. 4-A2]
MGMHEALYTTLFACCFGGRGDLWDAFDAVARRHAGGVSADLALYCSVFTDTAQQSRAVRIRIREQLSGSAPGRQDWFPPRLGLAAMQIDALDECRSRLRTALEHERGGGTLSSRLCCLLLLAVEARLSGSWKESSGYAREGLALAEEADYQLYAWALRCQLLLLAACRGDAATAQDMAKKIAAWAGPRRVGLATAAVLHARALLALSEGNYEEAYGLTSRAVPLGGPDPRVPYVAAMVMDLVEAAMRTGRTEEAKACAAAARRVGLDQVSPRMEMLTRAAEALAAGDGDQAGQVFADALADPGTSRWPFERARVQLCYGGWLRRARHLSDARTQLRAALDTFEGLGL